MFNETPEEAYKRISNSPFCITIYDKKGNPKQRIYYANGKAKSQDLRKKRKKDRCGVKVRELKDDE